MTQFKDLTLGQTFDFVSENRMYNSFYLRCTKVGMFSYRDERGAKYRVGSVTAAVFHVN